MASVQERLQLKRIPLDKWSIREQLFLAAAVACSGENWMSVSRSLKMYCGANRPSDWFSQKSCAAQYGKLLENVEMPKRKKRTASERDTPTSADTPGEVIYRKLTQERIQELKKQIQDEQKEFAKLKEDILYLHSSEMDDGKVREMWAQIELEKKQKEREQQQHQQWLKEREERKVEMEKAWRPGQLQTSSKPIENSEKGEMTHEKSFCDTIPGVLEMGRSFHPSRSRGSPLQAMMPLTSLKIKQEEMEIDDSASKQGTSPLLTSLLKSPSPAPNPTTPSIPAGITSSPTSSRSAPTITNLLTGGHQIHSSISTPEISQPIQFLPGLLDQQLSSTTTTTPSQAAPTLSMLLDKNTVKTETFPSSSPRPQSQIPPIAVEPKPEPMDIPQKNPAALPENVQEVVKDEDQQLMDDFNGLIPDNIDELADILTDNNAIILSPELLEEESILENVDSLIGNTDMAPKIKEEVPESTMVAENRPEQQEVIGAEIAPAEQGQEAPESIPSAQQEDVPEVKNEEIENSSSNESKNMDKGAQEPPPGEPEPIEIKSEPESSSDCEIRSDENSRPPHQEGDSSVQLMTTPDDSKSADDKSVPEDRSEDPKKDSDCSNSGGTDVPTTKNAEDPIKIEISTDDDDSNMKLSELCEKESQKEVVTIDLEEAREEKPDPDEVKVEQEEKSEEPGEKDVPETPKEVEEEAPAGASQAERKLSVEEDVFEDAKDTMENEEEEPQQDPAQAQSAGVDTDDDYPIEVIKEDKVGRTKRDYSRKKPETLSVDSKKSEDSNEDSKSNISLRMRLKDRERSESPLVTDDDGLEVIPRTRRRYSSTHATDSIPNSPASSEDREYKAWKKAIMPAYNRLSTHKYASIFLRPVAEDQLARYRSVILRPMDLNTIKRNLESGTIRTTAEFQRDVLLMCHNVMMFYKRDSSVYSMAKEVMNESATIIENAMESWKAAGTVSPAIPKMRSRKSQRHPASSN